MIQPHCLPGFIVAAFFAAATVSGTIHATEPNLWDALPQGVAYDGQVPTPEQFFGEDLTKIGGRHLHHHELVNYLRALDQVSDRITIEQYARSYSGRPLLVAIVTSPQNHTRLGEIQAERARWVDPRQPRPESPPLPVAYFGYTVHGNEASGANAAPLVLYHLAAAQGEQWQQYLERNVVLIDPCLNPDGLERFTNWIRDHRGQVANPDPLHREHRELWPGGRTNYYWFDLNRDWLPSEHPESQGRLALYRKWQPNLVLDFHEMGTHSTFFFQPGVPRRKHPLIPSTNVDLTKQIANLHATALDRVHALYYTEDTFDDFYVGKGSTYADLHGAVGILFEQASSRGLVQESPHGPLSFAFTVRNQLITSFSSLEALDQLREPLLNHQRAFFEEAIGPAAQHQSRVYLFSAPHDPVRRARFAALMQRHGIECYPLRADISANGIAFRTEDSLLVPSLQPERRFMEAIFERRTSFDESIFYDVSAWSVPLAYDMVQTETALNVDEVVDKSAQIEVPQNTFELAADDVAAIVDWRGYYAPQTLYRLLASDVLVKVASRPFAVDGPTGPLEFEQGSFTVPLGPQEEKRALIAEILQQGAQQNGLRIAAAKSALTREGGDLGGPKFEKIEKPLIAVIVGHDVRTSEAGEIWHLLDHRLSIPVTLLNIHDLGDADLDEYNVLVLVSGKYVSLPAATRDTLKIWTERGGTFVAIGTACELVAEQKWAEIQTMVKPAMEAERRPFAQAADDAAQQRISGAILQAVVDTSHPIAYGLRSTIPVFRDNNVMLARNNDPYSMPLVYSSSPLLCGYVSSKNLDSLAGTPAAIVRPLGKGRVIALADNPNFRAFWYGTNRIFLNALFYGSLVHGESTSASDHD